MLGGGYANVLSQQRQLVAEVNSGNRRLLQLAAAAVALAVALVAAVVADG
jgi:hypothetical protein